MSKKIYIDAFFEQYGEFLQQMVTVFPDDPDWARFRTGLAVFRRVSPMAIIKTTWEGVAPFEAIIQSRDEAFFLARGKEETSPNQDAIEYLITKLKKVWRLISLHNQNIIWDYVTNIMILAKRCVA
jgi:hypothetical protein